MALNICVFSIRGIAAISNNHVISRSFASIVSPSDLPSFRGFVFVEGDKRLRYGTIMMIGERHRDSNDDWEFIAYFATFNPG